MRPWSPSTVTKESKDMPLKSFFIAISKNNRTSSFKLPWFPLRDKTYSAPLSTILFTIFFWQPIASIVTIQPFISSRFSNSGMAVISLDFSSVIICPSVTRFSDAQALTTWIADLLDDLSWERRKVLPSIATTCPFVTLQTDRIQFRKRSSNSFGFITENTLPKVSWEGMPLGNFKNVLSQSYFAFP